MFRSIDPQMLMDEEERGLFQSLDDVVTVYRGVTSYNAQNVKALSWTLNREVAEWFAHRFGQNGTVYEAQVKKENIYAVFLGRNEEEVIVDPGRSWVSPSCRSRSRDREWRFLCRYRNSRLSQ